MAELGFKLIEARLAQSDWHVADYACYSSTDAVVVVAELLDDFGHALGCVGFWASDGSEGVDSFAVDCFDQLEELGVRGGRGVFGGWGEEVLVADGGDEGDDFDVMRQAEEFLGDGAGSDTACTDWVSQSNCLMFWVTHNVPIVSRALLRPPPLLALTPYFSR